MIKINRRELTKFFEKIEDEEDGVVQEVEHEDMEHS